MNPPTGVSGSVGAIDRFPGMGSFGIGGGRGVRGRQLGSGHWVGVGWGWGDGRGVMGEWLEFVFVAVGVSFVLVSFLFAVCIHISVEVRGNFSVDCVLPLALFGVFSLIIEFVISRSLCWHVIGHDFYLSTGPGKVSHVLGRIVFWGRLFPVLSVSGASVR